MASLFKVGKYFYIQFYDKRRSPPKRKFSLKTKRERTAIIKQKELEDAYVLGDFDPWTDDPWTYRDPPPVEQVDVEEALKRFLAFKEAEDRAPSTLRTYQKVVGRLSGPLRKVRAGDLVDQIHQDHLSRSTRRKRYRHIRSFFNWCLKQNLVDANPTESVPTPPRPRKIPKDVRPHELDLICDAIYADYEEKRTAPQMGNGIGRLDLIWMIPAFRFALYSGLRGGELARLRWKHVDFERKKIHIYKQKSRREGTAPLISQAEEILLEWKERQSVLGEVHPHHHVFGAHLDVERRYDEWRDNLSRGFRTYKRKAGIDRKISVHGLRHGFCTLLAEAGKSAVLIKEAARHASIETSMKYVHLAGKHVQSEVEQALAGVSG